MIKEMNYILDGQILRLVHTIFSTVILPGDTVVDCTCGNGKDTLALARLLKGKGRLIAYDIQKQALITTDSLLHQELNEAERQIVLLKLASHENIDEVNVKLFHYNLGYLPGSDKSIKTLAASTLRSIQKAIQSVSSQGVITIVCYPGHEEGFYETASVENFVQKLSNHEWIVSHYQLINRPMSPKLIVIKSIRKG